MSNPLNITTASFGGLREVATSPLWQWDYGQILEIKGLDLPQAFEVHFSNSRKSGETITQIGTDNQVVIPDMYLTSGADIYAFIFLHDGLTDGETEYVIKIPVRERPEPSDIEPTPEQQDAITEAIAALNTAVTQTAADVISAGASATAAAQSATNAQTAAQSAQGSATSASASATTASTAAATATTKASEAATSAANAASAKTAAETAETSAQAAQTASESAQASAESAAMTAMAEASDAEEFATSASGSASAASASASQASESATQASQSATAASGSATSAATSASTASTKASEASASATAAQTAQTAAEAAQTAAQTAAATFETDATLTVSGKAADAKATGDEISDLKADLNELFIPYEWLNGYYALGNGTFTPQTGTVTYHSTNKIDGDTIPPDSEFINSGYLYLSDSFFAVWDGNTYKGYLMNNVWHNPNGSVRSTPHVFTKYAIVLHNVSNYAGFGRRKYAVISETEAGVTGNDKASMVVDTVTFTNDDYVTYTTSLSYAYKLTKRVFIKSVSPYVPSGKTLYCYVLKRQSDGTYSTALSKTFRSEAVWNIGLTLDKDDALLFGYSGGTQYYSSTNSKDYLTKTYGWNSNTHKIIDSSLSYYIPATVVLYDPVSNYLLNYINNGNPCNWKGTECSLFDNILCIGDSITQGAPTPPDITPDQTKATRTVSNQTMYSYPASMKKQWGVECTNWGRSGIDTPDWYDYYSENEPSWSGHDAAIMLIGNNDYHIADDMGGLTPENLPTVSAMSKSAMMDIITKLKADNADIKIFICTLLPGWDTGNSLSPYVVQNIRDIASAEDNVYLIDLSAYSKIAQDSPYSYGHPTALGYNQLAREIGGAIGYTIVNNPDDFRWVQFIGTEYAMDED